MSMDAVQLYTTVTTRDVLLYNHGDGEQTVSGPDGPITVPPHTILALPRP